MNGAALYDIKDRRYVETVSLSPERVRNLRNFFMERGMNCFTNTRIDGVLLICFTELKICVYESDQYSGNSYIKIYDRRTSAST